MEYVSAEELGAIATEYQSRVYSYARYLTSSPEDAEDISQNAWHKFCKRVAQGDVHNGNVLAYLVRILRNEAIGLSARRETPAEGLEPVDPLNENADVTVRLLLEDCLPRLDPATARIIHARFFEGLTFQEICARDGLAYTSAHRLAKNGLLRLRTVLETAGIDLGDFAS